MMYLHGDLLAMMRIRHECDTAIYKVTIFQ